MASHEKHIDDLLRDALGDHTEQPPAGAWSDMEAKLDEGKTLIDVFFAAALSGHTETPPAHAWAHMEAKLDGKTAFDHAFEEVLGDYAETPPADAWANMEARLDKKPGRRRGIVWLWSAAAVAGLLLLGYFLKENSEQHSAKRQTEIKTETTITTAPVINTPAAQPEVSTEQPVTDPQNEPKHVARTPKVNASVAHSKASEQQALPVVQKETPAQDPAPEAQQMLAEPKQVAVQNDSAKRTKQVNADDIASAIRRRAKGTVMNLKRSRYADSVAEAEQVAQQKANEEKAKQQDVPTGVVEPVQEPVIAANIDSVKDMANEVAVAQPDTMSALVQDALNSTLKSMEVTQDAMPAQADPQVTNALAEMGTLASKAAEIATADPDKGTLAPFIGPAEDTEANAAALMASAGNTIEDAPMIIRTPVKLDWFLKTGYEAGLNKHTVNKFVFAPTMQINFTDKFSVLLQPAIKTGKVNYQVNSNGAYHAITSSDHDTLINYWTAHSAQGIITDSMRVGYYYKQTYDSIVVSNSFASRTVVEAELPILLSYKVGKNISLYGGPVVTYSSILQIDTKYDIHGSFTRLDSVKYAQSKIGAKQDPPPAPAMGDVIQYDTKNIDQYNNAPYLLAPNKPVNKIRMGYMLGASYNYKRLTADITVQQNLSRMDYLANPGVRGIYLQPYMRFMLGLKLNK